MLHLHDDAVNVAGYQAADVARNVGASLDRTQRLVTAIANDGKTAWWAVGLLLAGMAFQVTSTARQVIYGGY
jgi:hypothetical protein